MKTNVMIDSKELSLELLLEVNLFSQVPVTLR